MREWLEAGGVPQGTGCAEVTCRGTYTKDYNEICVFRKISLSDRLHFFFTLRGKTENVHKTTFISLHYLFACPYCHSNSATM